MVNIYKSGDFFIWIPVAKESDKHPGARAFLPDRGLEEKYLHGYKAEISEDFYLISLADIQQSFIKNEHKFFKVNTSKGTEKQYKAKWRHGRKRDSPLLGPTKGWVKIPFTRLTEITEKELEDALNNTSGKFAEIGDKFIQPILCETEEALEKEVENLRKTIANKIPLGQKNPPNNKRHVPNFQRDAAVVAYILNDASGMCSLCEKYSPFKKTNGEPYLEVHHVKQLSKGGSDRISNAVALCPNCHRELHFGVDSEILTEKLYERINRLLKE